MQELLHLKNENQLTPEQALWFQQPKAKEELYDITKDPHELNNLANDPNYKEDLERLRNICENWVEEINDTGLRPENDLVEEFWPKGVQPRTENPVFIYDQGKLTIQCPTEEASLGYRLVDPESDKRTTWKVYDAPIDVPANCTLEAVAHRLGYKRSFIETLVLGVGK